MLLVIPLMIKLSKLKYIAEGELKVTKIVEVESRLNKNRQPGINKQEPPFYYTSTSI